MSKGYWARTAKEHATIRRLYKERVAELGELAKEMTRTYYYNYIKEKTGGKAGYSISRIKQILNMKQEEINLREIED